MATGEPHYAQSIPADIISKNSVKIFNIEENKSSGVSKGEKEAKVVREGNKVHVYMTAIRSHLHPIILKG